MNIKLCRVRENRSGNRCRYIETRTLFFESPMVFETFQSVRKHRDSHSRRFPIWDYPWIDKDTYSFRKLEEAETIERYITLERCQLSSSLDVFESLLSLERAKASGGFGASCASLFIPPDDSIVFHKKKTMNNRPFVTFRIHDFDFWPETKSKFHLKMQMMQIPVIAKHRD